MKEYIGMQLNVINYNTKLNNHLLKELNKSIAIAYGNKVKVEFLDAEHYWKFPEETQCWFSFSANAFISVKEIVSLFQVKYSYLITSNKINESPLEEEAIWALYVQGGEFLDTNVVWAHLYTYCLDMEEEEK